MMSAALAANDGRGGGGEKKKRRGICVCVCATTRLTTTTQEEDEEEREVEVRGKVGKESTSLYFFDSSNRFYKQVSTRCRLGFAAVFAL